MYVEHVALAVCQQFGQVFIQALVIRAGRNLAVAHAGVALRNVQRTCANRRVCRSNAAVCVGMSRKHDIDIVLFRDRRDVLAGIQILIGMVHGQYAEIRVLRLVRLQVIAQPFERLFHVRMRLCACAAACRIRVQLEQRPRVGVHHREVRIAVVKGDIGAVGIGMEFLLLHLGHIRVKIFAIIMITAVIDYRNVFDKFCAVFEPEIKLILLGARAFHHIAGVQDKIRAVGHDVITDLLRGFKLMCIRNHHKVDVVRVFAQRFERTVFHRTVLQFNAVLIKRIRGQVFQLRPVNVHFLAFKSRAIL